MKYSRAFLLMILVAAMFATTGCKHAVTFERHVPYQAPDYYDAPLIVVVPNDIDEVQYSARLGLFPEPKSFKIFYGQALKEETAARFARMYNRIVIIDEMMYEEATDPVTASIQGTELNMGTYDYEFDSASEIDADLLKILQSPDGYLLRYRSIDFYMEDKKTILSVNAEFTDRFTGQTLFEGRISGAGDSIIEYNAIGNLKQELKRSTIGACTAVLVRLSRTMVDGIEGPQYRG
ncbi:hypothetical protein KQI84_18210 [bacterium]|nr:hypothetical protein [bacterium]